MSQKIDLFFVSRAPILKRRRLVELSFENLGSQLPVISFESETVGHEITCDYDRADLRFKDSATQPSVKPHFHRGIAIATSLEMAIIVSLRTV